MPKKEGAGANLKNIIPPNKKSKEMYPCFR